MTPSISLIIYCEIQATEQMVGAVLFCLVMIRIKCIRSPLCDKIDNFLF